MDKHKRYGKFNVRILKEEKAMYSLDNPNPQWETLGRAWIEFARNLQEKKQYTVAYLPHIPIGILQDNKEHEVVPTEWDIEELPEVGNLSLGGEDHLFRLNARYCPRGGPIVGSRKNVDLSPTEDEMAVLGLFKLAEKIYPVGAIEHEDHFPKDTED